MELKFHRSVTLSKRAIEFVSSLEGFSFSSNLEKIIKAYEGSSVENKRAENLAQFRTCIRVLREDCSCPEAAVRAWTRDALKAVK